MQLASQRQTGDLGGLFVPVVPGAYTLLGLTPGNQELGSYHLRPKNAGKQQSE